MSVDMVNFIRFAPLVSTAIHTCTHRGISAAFSNALHAFIDEALSVADPYSASHVGGFTRQTDRYWILLIVTLLTLRNYTERGSMGDLILATRELGAAVDTCFACPAFQRVWSTSTYF